MDDLVKRLRFELRDWNGKNRFAFKKVNALVIAEAADRIKALQAEVARYRKGLTQIAGSHWERWGICQTDIDEIPDLSGDESMNLARQLLGEADDARQALKGTDNAE